MSIRMETELYEPVKSFLEQLGYQVRSEVKNCDVVAVREDRNYPRQEPVIVELKKTFNLRLLVQGMERLKLSSQVYLAIEDQRKKRVAGTLKWREVVQLCERMGLGLITVTFYKNKKPLVEVLCEPLSDSSHVSKRKSKGLLTEFRERSGDYNIGGGTGRKLITAYREKALHCAMLLQQHDSLSPLQLRELSGIKESAGILQRNYYGWFERVTRGVYRLSTEGEKALSEYQHVVEKRKALQADYASDQ